MDYRSEARKSLERAKKNLEKDDASDTRYAALDLRMALESLIYEKAQNYKGELSPKILSTWQPRKLLVHILEIDPDADKSSSLAVGIEEEYGKPSTDMKFLGTENVLSLTNIKKYYDRIGSYLHSPTIEQVDQKKSASPEKMKIRCEELINILNAVLSSFIFNTDMHQKIDWLCEKCGTKIIRRIPSGVSVFKACCTECNATYQVKSEDELNFHRVPMTHEVTCTDNDCEQQTRLWDNDIALGNKWNCSSCGLKHKFSLGLEVLAGE